MIMAKPDAHMVKISYVAPLVSGA